MFFWPFHGFFLWWLFGRGLTTIIILVVVIWALTSMRRHPYGATYVAPGSPPQPGPVMPGTAPANAAALDIVEQRYARGEIQRDEYLQKKADILNRSV